MTLKRVVCGMLGAGAVIALSAPAASAAKGGEPQFNSCGVGRSNSEAARADQTRPGASEYREVPPVEFGCTGKG